MTLRSRILAREALTGLWQVLPGPVAAEIAGAAGFDFLVHDGEHGPWDPSDLRTRLAASRTEGVIRVPANEAWLVKQALDLGARTVLVPMVDDAAQAEAAVRAARYPPEGIRGNGAYVARASGYGRDVCYVAEANARTSVWVQAESRRALGNLEAIAAVPGVDCVFLGPADLAADMGFATEPRHPEVIAAVEDAIARLAATGIPCGAFGPPDLMDRWRALGANVLAAGADGTALAAALAALPR
ncbi:HpcH/HpaI aldolase/citrate lyase family protein [Jannaschia sp. W003]|uniref:HpcH/HpaI aldolase family protein n=1 Tax=Jannaschia sp. W003 TaxID=2867012 RepID=UPI0021A7F00A|nr:aldolase/citrate lyase family protein [Jannaschia sp. W003]UWQ20406.1 2-keto-3-deoxy-L-rhamnonate aldolase [Jannaschia sp. W003]